MSGGYIYISTDGGETWTAKNISLGNQNWTSIIQSSDGTKLAACVSGGYIYTSNDGGETWIQSTSSGIKDWIAITSSSDGSKLAACSNSNRNIWIKE